MPIQIRMPALSPTMEKGNLTRWFKKEGDRVRPGEVIAEIETDKATMEYEAVDEGTLAKIIVPEGTPDVPVNQVIAVLAEEGEDIKAVAAMPVHARAARPQVATSPNPPPAPAAAPAAPPQTAVLPLQPRGAPAPAARSGMGAARTFASPLARRLARDAGVDIARIAGSGPHGRVIARDVQAARAGAPQRVAAAQAMAAPAQIPADDKIRALFQPGSYEVVPHDTMRKVIAQRLTLAKQTIPHYYLTIECDIGRLLAAREEINAAAPKAEGVPAYKVSVNDFVIKALALALQKVPDANVTWTESAMLRHKHSDIGVAVAIQGGLITPVVRKAETKSLSAISNEMKDFAARARACRLKPEEYQGGSAAVSNLGMYGISNFAAVINPPHALILAVGAGEERAVARNGRLEAATMMTVTLSADHRAVDGAVGAELLRAFKALIENPVMMVV
ncbi:MAG TPA: pyruvate dehydrogenase complex dihydrolipoamide acetyltransferase [Xanthobacteraceae bacterium]|nr:pyruvate dehydrogenase complex dihydrolipoamide acetyltransferase [Xanthobacteraceae bacterium]